MLSHINFSLADCQLVSLIHPQPSDSAFPLPRIPLDWFFCSIYSCPFISLTALFWKMRVIHIHRVQRLSHNQHKAIGWYKPPWVKCLLESYKRLWTWSPRTSMSGRRGRTGRGVGDKGNDGDSSTVAVEQTSNLFSNTWIWQIKFWEVLPNWAKMLIFFSAKDTIWKVKRVNITFIY